MFNILKNYRPKLSDIIPKNYTDIHCHLLPGIDDGAETVSDSLNLINKMKKLGFTKIIATPHTYPGLYNNTNETIRNSYNEVIRNLKNKINIEYASEYMIDNSFLEKIGKDNLLVLKDNYVLVEMSFMSPPLKLYDIIFELQINNYIPVLAHPERYRFMHNNLSEYKKLKKLGCLFQLNILSCTDYYGKDITKISDKLIQNELIDFTGSDIHNMNHILSFEKKVNFSKNTLQKLNDLMTNNNLFD